MTDLIDVFNLLFDTSLGTLWRAREDLLKEIVENYDQGSDRQCHPLLSARRNRPISLERIPMFIGSSHGMRKSFQVENVFEADGSITYFDGTIVPMPPPVFMESDPERAKARKKKLIGSFLEGKRLVVNWTKPKLDDTETERFDHWLSIRGL